jgi:hypothetical protein
MSDQLPSRDEPAADTNIKPGLPSAPAPRPVETIAYQPVSGWAVAGLVTSSFFALLVLGSTIVALSQGAPIFFPVWVLSLALVGIVLSFIGQSHVQNSEGTRTGAKLATAGIWLGVVSGLCYFSYYYATRYAQAAQANDFLMTEADGPDTGFFQHLCKSANPTELNIAFLLTRPITARSGNPKDSKSMALNNDVAGKEGKGDLSTFKESIMPRALFKDLGKDAEITPLAVQDWRYEKKSYQITRSYSIKTKEVELEMALTVASTEAEASGQGRTWFLNLRESGIVKKELTKFGKGIATLRARAREWVEQQWLAKLNEGQPFHAIKDKSMDRTAWHEIMLQDQKPEALQASFYRLFESSKKDRLKGLFNIATRPDDIGFWEMADGKIRIYLHFQLIMLKEGNPPTQGNTLDGYVMVETRQVVDPSQFDIASPPPDWAMVGIVITHSTPPGGPGLR